MRRQRVAGPAEASRPYSRVLDNEGATEAAEPAEVPQELPQDVEEESGDIPLQMEPPEHRIDPDESMSNETRERVKDISARVKFEVRRAHRGSGTAVRRCLPD